MIVVIASAGAVGVGVIGIGVFVYKRRKASAKRDNGMSSKLHTTVNSNQQPQYSNYMMGMMNSSIQNVHGNGMVPVNNRITSLSPLKHLQGTSLQSLNSQSQNLLLSGFSQGVSSASLPQMERQVSFTGLQRLSPNGDNPQQFGTPILPSSMSPNVRTTMIMPGFSLQTQNITNLTRTSDFASMTRISNNATRRTNFTRTMLNVQTKEILAYPAFLEFNVTNSIRLSVKIGEGGFGTLYEGDIQNAELVRKFNTTKCAVKLLKEPNVKSAEEYAKAVEEQFEEFKHEVSVMYSLQDCENIIKIIGCARVPKVTMVTKLYRMNLKEFAITKPIVELDMKLVASLAYDMLNGIDAMHKRDFGELLISLCEGSRHLSNSLPSTQPTKISNRITCSSKSSPKANYPLTISPNLQNYTNPASGVLYFAISD